MTIEELFSQYEAEFLSLNKSLVGAKGKKIEDVASGIRGEAAVKEILSRYADDIREEVVLWNKKGKFTPEMDFVARVNGYLLLVEAKEWYGELAPSHKNEEVHLSFVNLNGWSATQRRTNPVYAMGSFTSDLMRWLGNDKPRNGQMKRFVVFTRKDLIMKKNMSSSNVNVCYLDGFESSLKKLLEETNENPYLLPHALPSWDYYRNKNGNWFKLAVKSREIGGITLKVIDSVLFLEKEEAAIKTLDGRIVVTSVSKGDIETVAIYRTMDWNAVFLKLDRLLHAETSYEGSGPEDG